MNSSARTVLSGMACSIFLAVLCLLLTFITAAYYIFPIGQNELLVCSYKTKKKKMYGIEIVNVQVTFKRRKKIRFMHAAWYLWLRRKKTEEHVWFTQSESNRSDVTFFNVHLTLNIDEPAISLRVWECRGNKLVTAW